MLWKKVPAEGRASAVPGTRTILILPQLDSNIARSASYDKSDLTAEDSDGPVVVVVTHNAYDPPPPSFMATTSTYKSDKYYSKREDIGGEGGEESFTYSTLRVVSINGSGRIKERREID